MAPARPQLPSIQVSFHYDRVLLVVGKTHQIANSIQSERSAHRWQEVRFLTDLFAFNEYFPPVDFARKWVIQNFKSVSSRSAFSTFELSGQMSRAFSVMTRPSLMV